MTARLRSLVLERYGAYEGRDLELGPGLTIVSGPNEAGKTTLLDALSDLLWGMPRPAKHAYAFSPARLAVAACVEGPGGERTLRRTTRGLHADDDVAVDAPWGEGGAEARRRWREGFGLGHEQLRAGGRKLCAGGGDLAELVFTARSGRDARALIAALDAEADALYKEHRGSRSVAVRTAFARFTETEQAAADRTSRAGEVTALADEIGRLERRAAELGRTRRSAADAADRARQAVRAQDPARELAALRAERTALCSTGAALDADSLAEYTRASEDRAAAEQERDEHREHADGLRARRAELDLDEDLLADATRIRELESAAQARRADADRADRLRSDAAEAHRRAESALAGLVAEDGRTADERLAAVHLPADRARDLDAIAARLHEAAVEAERAERLHTEALAEVREAADVPGGLDAEQVGRVAEVRRAIEAEGSAAALCRAAVVERDAAVARRSEALAAAGHRGPATGGAAGTAGPTVLAPPVREVRSARTALRAAEQDLRAAERAAAEADDRAHRARSARDGVAARGRPVGPDALAAARTERDAAVAALLEAGPDGTATAAGRVTAAVAAADRVADDMIASADRVAELAHREAELESATTGSEAAGSGVAEARERTGAAGNAWSTLWRSHGVAVPDPDDADTVLSALGDAARAQDEVARADERLARLRDQADEQQRALGAALAAAGRPRDGAPLDVLLLAAEDLATEAGHARDRLVLLHRLRSDAERAGGAADAARHERELAGQRWRFALRGAGLPTDLEPSGWGTRRDTVADAQQAGALARQDDAEARRLERAVNAHRRAVTALVERHLEKAPTGTAPEDRLGELADRVREVTKGAVSAGHLDDGIVAAEDAAARAARAVATAGAILDRLAVELALTEAMEPGGLEAAAERGGVVADLDARIAEQSRLLAAAAPDLDAGELVASAPDTEPGALTEALDRAETHETELGAEQDEVREQLGGLRARRRELEEAEGAAELHARAQSELAGVAEAAERYLVLHLQREILRRELEAYERSHASPLLVRAGALLEQLTSSRFVALRPPSEPGGGARTLVAVRGDGEELVPEKLSEGTADQVHLALRLAGIEQLQADRAAAVLPPVPVVLDDVLMTFDDERAHAAIRVLAELAGSQQVLLFTHHEHLVGLARSTGADFAVAELGPPARVDAVLDADAARATPLAG
ncbi:MULTISPECIES: AAA family ATPase [unclassified Pseudonocardia]|uniref:AAA family ATPase n=1 Tax=unclassified Pseudonocardia TaxID=2619320 RepID=UPI00094ADA72|nr:AAA family ATPase [Pseudonocardia sp. Ae707_Ps1]OLM18429.1 Exonuclease SbcC [Pseudonocardia sp. Ae707_Ps1]